MCVKYQQYKYRQINPASGCSATSLLTLPCLATCFPTTHEFHSWFVWKGRILVGDHLKAMTTWLCCASFRDHLQITDMGRPVENNTMRCVREARGQAAGISECPVRLTPSVKLQHTSVTMHTTPALSTHSTTCNMTPNYTFLPKSKKSIVYFSILMKCAVLFKLRKVSLQHVCSFHLV